MLTGQGGLQNDESLLPSGHPVHPIDPVHSPSFETRQRRESRQDEQDLKDMSLEIRSAPSRIFAHALPSR